MRVADSLEIPDELIRANDAGELVIFAGAGVSMGPPSCLPDFEQLARQIAEPRIPWEDKYSERLDEYLGHAAAARVDVDARARELLRRPGGHTTLHQDLLQLFTRPDRVRLITTNFDTHFTTAAQVVFPRPPGEPFPLARYVGPALPPGRDFAGLAQIHGALDHPYTPLVLTNANFADAYMAHGWATRFLFDVFAGRAVLFVGYSVRDPLIRYLLSAIPPTGRWFALWSEEEVARQPHYAELGVHAITFRSASSGDPFGDLNAGVSHWSWYCRARQLDHTERVEQLSAAGPPASPLDEDYLRERLKTDAGREAFWRSATSPAWLWWAASNGYLNALTDPGSTDVTALEWGWWCVQRFLEGEAPPLLKWLHTRPFSLHPAFAARLRWYLWTTKPWPPIPVVRQLLALLLSQPPVWGQEGYDWEWLLGRLLNEGCIEEAVAALRYATQLRLEAIEETYRLLRAMYAEGEEPEPPRAPLSIHVTTLLDPRRLEQFLSENGANLAAAAASEMLALAEARIAEAYELLDLARGEAEHDWLSLNRMRIVAPFHGLARGGDVLVDLARAAIEHLALTAPAQLESFIGRADQSRRTLVRRLAVYAASQLPDACSDELLAAATDRGWAQTPKLQREVFLFLGAHYGSASEFTRRDFISAVLQIETWGDVSEEHLRRLRFDLAQKLLAIAPGSDVTARFASAEREANPDWDAWDPSDEAELPTEMDEVEPDSQLDVADVVAWAPAEVVARLQAAFGRATDSDFVPTAYDALRRAAASSLNWATAVFIETAQGDEVARQVAKTVLWGVRDAEAAHVDGKIMFLRAAASGAWAQELIDPIATVLDVWSGALNHNEPTPLLDALDGAADVVYTRVDVEGDDPEHTWTDEAVTHAPGKAALTWLRVASARDWQDDTFVISLDDAERKRWERVVGDTSAAGDWARPILGMGTDRFSVGDLPWATATVFPLFNVARDARKAAQVWDGRLSAMRWSWATIEALRPHLPGLFDISATLLPNRDKQLGDWVAMLVAASGRISFSLALLERFIGHATEDARVAFAGALPRHLRSLEPGAREQLWSDLLSPYWFDRRTNVPCALSSSEMREMARWAEGLPEVAADVVAEMRALPPGKIDHAEAIIARWKRSDSWTRAHPEEAAAIIRLLVERESLPRWTADDAAEILTSCFDDGAERATVSAATERLVALGSSVARRLAERLRDG